ncbi:hypothetical protein RHMOL_Rhmol10G0227600 [Rhododendron molle]|uniref:Uncharacterized protein n=1 Tax=Rhododendron molle TaxID=49168 RepID=A0ACC0M4V0_RHOML|nr:hypothetical protein RHMOL_Rhmol10G0227600 [Rhododendron molle]
MNLQFSPPNVEGDRTRVSPPRAVELLCYEKWKDCIVGHFVDKKLPFPVVRSIAFKVGGRFGLKEVLSNDKGFFFQFGVEDACRKIVESGSWHFGGRLMVLQEWDSDLDFEKESLVKIPILDSNL